MKNLIVLLLVALLISNSSAQDLNLSNNLEFQSPEAILNRFSGGIKIQTISPDPEDSSTATSFLEFHKYVREMYPLVHQNLQVQIINNYSLLYKWNGADATLNPALLISHIDVVPVEAASAHDWEHPPFSGNIEKGYIWGRGTIDVKMSIFAILEASEKLLTEGFQPERTLYFAFGHDEETGGYYGAAFIAKFLHDQQIELEYVLDEGGGIGEGVINFINKPIAFVSIAEKGYLTAELSVNVKGGHSSAPVLESSIDILNRSLHRFINSNNKIELTAPVQLMLNALGEETNGIKGVALRNSIFNPLVKKQLKKDNLTATIITNTRAVTILQSGTKENVIPTVATAKVNFRLLPGTDSSDITQLLRKSIKDNRVNIKVIKYHEAAKVSDVNHTAFATVKETIHEVFPATAVIPTLNIAGTDSYHYRNLTDNIIRFVPIELHADEASCIHGVNEKISVSNYLKAIDFYYVFIRKNNVNSQNELVQN